MKLYEKPEILEQAGLAEGVYMASGAGDSTSASNGNGPKCDSKYMKGVFQQPDYTTSSSYKERFGCNGCPAFRWNACGLETDYVDSGYASSYDVDNGNRMPGWERKGHKANDPVTDYNV